jgi:hypothetical protein
MLVGSTAIASAQGGSTDRDCNAIGSQHVGNGGSMTNGAMHNSAHATTGMSSGRSNPNGSPMRHPLPQGDPSKDADAPK